MSKAEEPMTEKEIAANLQAFAEEGNKRFNFDYLMEGIADATAKVLETVPAPKADEKARLVGVKVPPRRVYAQCAKQFQADLKHAVAAGDVKRVAVLALHLGGAVSGFDIAIYRDILEGANSAGIAWRGGFVKCKPGTKARLVLECVVETDSTSLSDLGLRVWNNRTVDQRTVDTVISDLKNRMVEGKCACILSRDGDLISVVPRKGHIG